jgi:hypothetical protein
MKGMGLTQARTILYGNFQRDKAEFDGLFTRRNSLKYRMPDGSLIDSPYVFDAGGTGSSLTSVYLVAFGQENLSMIYPRGSGGSVGVSREDMTGPEGRLITDPRQAGKEYRVYTEFFKAQYGIVVKNPAALIRIANIPASMTGDAIVDKILEAGYSMVSGASTYCMYSNKDIMIKIDKAARDKGNVVYYAEDPWGRKITYVRDFRCRRMDVITNNEAQVTAA